MKRSLPILLVLSLLGLAPAYAGSRTTSSNPIEVVRRAGSRTPTSVTGIVEAPRSGRPVEAARLHLAAHASRYALDTDDLTTLDVIADGTQRTVRFGQTVNDVPVFGAQYLVHLDTADSGYSVQSVNGHLFPDLTVDTEPSVGEYRARALVAKRSIRLRPTQIEKHGLVVLTPGLGLPIKERGALAWHFTVRGPQLRWEVFLSAATGRTILAYDNLHRDGPVVASGHNSRGERVDVQAYERGRILEMRDQTRAMFAMGGEITTHSERLARGINAKEGNIVTTASTLFSDGTAVDAHVNTGKVYEFYLRLGRNSIDGEGGDVLSIVHSSAAGDCNASWDGLQMSYADCSLKRVASFASELDVVGHELTHGVTEKTGNLIYIGQSGAMNEGYSDYFGNAIDVEYSGMSMTHPEAGYVGEDLCEEPPPKHFPCPLRNLNDGRTTDDFIFFPLETDLAGVHENSTIFSGALWTIREQLGGAKADAYVYKALSEFTTPLDTFLDGRDSMLSAAASLGATPLDLETISAAFVEQDIVDGWDDGEGTNDGTILLPDIDTLDPAVAAPDVDGNLYAVGDLVGDDDLFLGPFHIVVGSVDGTQTSTAVSGPLAENEGDGQPAISGNRVVWSRLEFSKNRRFVRDQDIYTTTVGGTVEPVATTKNIESLPAIDGDLIAWESYNRDKDVSHVWAMRVGGEPFKVSGGGALYNTAPAVSGDWIVWSGFDFENATLQMVNVTSGETATIKSQKDNFFVGPPEVSDNFLYWMEGESIKYSIFRAPLGSSERTLVLDKREPLAPRGPWFATTTLSANDEFLTYVYEPGRAEGEKRYQQTRDVMILSAAGGGTPEPVTTNRGDQSYAAIGDGRRVVWFDSSRGRIHLMTKLVP